MTDAPTPVVLRHGKLTAELVPLLKAGSSVLRHRFGDIGTFRELDGSERLRINVENDCGTAGDRFHRFTYIGECDADGWIHAPEGGWNENPVGDVEVEAENIGGTSGAAPGQFHDWPNIKRFRLSDQPLSPEEGSDIFDRLDAAFPECGSLPAASRPSVPTEGVTASGDDVPNAGPPLQMIYELRHPHRERVGWEDNAALMAAAADEIEMLHGLPVENSPSPALGGTEAEGRSEPESPTTTELSKNLGELNPTPVGGLEPVAWRFRWKVSGTLVSWQAQAREPRSTDPTFEVEPLYSSSTVSTLQAEIERLRADAETWKARHASLLAAVEKAHVQEARQALGKHHD